MMMFGTGENEEKSDSIYLFFNFVFSSLEIITVFTGKLSNHIPDILGGLSQLRDSLTAGKSYYCLL